MHQHLENYLTHLKQKKYSTSTINGYNCYLQQFLVYISGLKITDFSFLTATHLTMYTRHRLLFVNKYGTKNKPSTRFGELMALKSFLLYLLDRKLIKKDLSQSLIIPKVSRHNLPAILTKADLMLLFSLPDTSTMRGYRDRAILETLYATGIRRTELCNLKIEDINFENKTVFIRNGKGGGDRVVPINNTALHFIHHYINYLRTVDSSWSIVDSKVNDRPSTINQQLSTALSRPSTINHKPSTVLFLSKYKEQFVSLNKILNKYLRKLPDYKTKKYTIHSLRHTFATHLLNTRMPLRHIQEILGHKSIDTTSIYLNLDISQLQKEYKKYHPLETKND